MKHRGSFLLIIGLLLTVFVILLSGCGALVAEPTPTPIPTLTPMPTPDHSILAADMRKDSPEKSSVVYTLPEMDQITVANVAYKDVLTMDVYYPQNFSFDQNLPVVIFVNGFPDEVAAEMLGAGLKDTGIYISWGQLVAAAGMSAITYEVAEPDVDIYDLISYVQANAAQLRLDKDRICIWSSSGNTPTAVVALTDSSRAYRDSLACAVLYYGYTPPTIDPDGLSADIPWFIVKAGTDDPSLNLKLDNFIRKIRAAEVPLELVEYEDGIHGFEVWQDTDESREIIQQTIEFMKTNFQEAQQ